MKKRVIAAFSIIIFALTMAATAFAATTGTVTVVLMAKDSADNDVPLSGFEVNVYRVADVGYAGSERVFTLEGDFAGFLGFAEFEEGPPLVISNDLQHREHADQLVAYMESLADMGSAPAAYRSPALVTDAAGKAVFENLEQGMYLFISLPGSGSPSEYSNYLVSPVLAVLPDYGRADPWDVVALPKTGAPPVKPPPPVKPTAEPVSVLIYGNKDVTGPSDAHIPEREFTFTAVQVDSLGAIGYTGAGEPLSGRNAIWGAGEFTIRISGLPVPDSSQNYYFLVREEQTGDGEDGWSFSKEYFWVRVTVTNDEDGEASASVTAIVDKEGTVANTISFTNTFGVVISCEVDKDTIRRTSAAYVSLPGQEGFNNVGKEDEMFRYDINFRNTSNVDVDEFVVDDPLENVKLDYVRVEVLWTPIVWGDVDGLFNLWYRTNMTDDSTVYSTATANSDVTEPAFPNTGFKLWRAGLSTDSRVRLDVSGLGLAEGEYVTALRFEYGAVMMGFTSMNYARTSLNGEHRAQSHGPLLLQANNSDIMQAVPPPLPSPLVNSIFGDVVDWTPGIERHDYAEGAANAAGLQPISFLVSAAKPMFEGDIINSAIARTAKGDLRDWDQDAVVTRLITTFEGGAGSFEFTPGTVESLFIDNAESAGWNIMEGGRLEELDFDETEIPLGYLEIGEPEIPTGPAFPSGSTVPRTGDTSMPGLWAALMAVSGCAIIALLLLRRRVRGWGL